MIAIVSKPNGSHQTLQTVFGARESDARPNLISKPTCLFSDGVEAVHFCERRGYHAEVEALHRGLRRRVCLGALMKVC
jgi:hypothetical protein